MIHHEGDSQPAFPCRSRGRRCWVPPRPRGCPGRRSDRHRLQRTGAVDGHRTATPGATTPLASARPDVRAAPPSRWLIAFGDGTGYQVAKHARRSTAGERIRGVRPSGTPSSSAPQIAAHAAPITVHSSAPLRSRHPGPVARPTACATARPDIAASRHSVGRAATAPSAVPYHGTLLPSPGTAGTAAPGRQRGVARG